jgi:hypothetical protein
MEKLQLDYSAESGKNRKMAHLVNIACARFILVHQALHCNAALRPRLTSRRRGSWFASCLALLQVTRYVSSSSGCGLCVYSIFL